MAIELEDAAVERWLNQLEPDDRVVTARAIESLEAAADKFHDAVAAAVATSLPLGLVELFVDRLDDRLSVTLRPGETIPAQQLWEDLSLKHEAERD